MEFVNVLSVALAAEKSVLAVKGMEASLFFIRELGFTIYVISGLDFRRHSLFIRALGFKV